MPAYGMESWGKKNIKERSVSIHFTWTCAKYSMGGQTRHQTFKKKAVVKGGKRGK